MLTVTKATPTLNNVRCCEHVGNTIVLLERIRGIEEGDRAEMAEESVFVWRRPPCLLIFQGGGGTNKDA